ncbi:hypothetical protein ABZ470_17200 [Streptosporangium sp. NPDC020072]|uniref:hypothetical protein n=1 Tax=Streptosporangium sp. NPDC020072 TaxID=3154788 RepID=UPI003441EAC2
MDVLVWILMAILVPLLVTEFGELAPWLARKVIGLSAHLIVHPVEREERRQEWLAALPEVPGKIVKLLDALSILLYVVPRMWIAYGVPGGPRHRRIKRALEFGPNLVRHAFFTLNGAAADELPAFVTAQGSKVNIFRYVDPLPHDVSEDVECGDPRLAKVIVDLAERLFAAPPTVDWRKVLGEEPATGGAAKAATHGAGTR